jgi:hypothetical protein
MNLASSEISPGVEMTVVEFQTQPDNNIKIIVMKISFMYLASSEISPGVEMTGAETSNPVRPESSGPAQTPNVKPETSNFKLQTSNFKPQTSNLKLQTSIPTHTIIASYIRGSFPFSIGLKF